MKASSITILTKPASTNDVQVLERLTKCKMNTVKNIEVIVDFEYEVAELPTLYSPGSEETVELLDIKVNMLLKTNEYCKLSLNQIFSIVEKIKTTKIIKLCEENISNSNKTDFICCLDELLDYD